MEEIPQLPTAARSEQGLLILPARSASPTSPRPSTPRVDRNQTDSINDAQPEKILTISRNSQGLFVPPKRTTTPITSRPSTPRSNSHKNGNNNVVDNLSAESPAVISISRTTSGFFVPSSNPSTQPSTPSELARINSIPNLPEVAPSTAPELQPIEYWGGALASSIHSEDGLHLDRRRGSAIPEVFQEKYQRGPSTVVGSFWFRNRMILGVLLTVGLIAGLGVGIGVGVTRSKHAASATAAGNDTANGTSSSPESTGATPTSLLIDTSGSSSSSPATSSKRVATVTTSGSSLDSVFHSITPAPSSSQQTSFSTSSLPTGTIQTCSWKGHCLGAPCWDLNDCSDPYPCILSNSIPLLQPVGVTGTCGSPSQTNGWDPRSTYTGGPVSGSTTATTASTSIIPNQAGRRSVGRYRQGMAAPVAKPSRNG